MRLFLSTIMAATLAAGPVLAADCLHAPDHVALDVMALKTQLMVTALTCKADERYNAFILKYQPDLQREDRSLNAYFTRMFGRSSQKSRDDYVTQLANAQSSEGLKRGSLYCDENLPAFDEVMALRSDTELAQYAAGRQIAQPSNIGNCTTSATAASERSTAGSSKARSTTRRRKS